MKIANSTTIAKKQERFDRVATRRTKKAIEQIRLLKKCSSRSSYSFTDEQVEQIFNALGKAIYDARQAFEPVEDVSFSLEN